MPANATFPLRPRDLQRHRFRDRKGEKIAAYAGLSATHPLIKEIGELRRGIGPRSVRAKQKLEN